jgi:hypothetical protein
MPKNTDKVLLTGMAALALLVGPLAVFASSNSTFTQVISAGVLITDIRDASRVTVASPAVAMSAKTFSFSCQSGGSASTGTFGTNTERIYVDNPSAANNGWTLTLAATSGATALWTDGTNTYDFNDAGGAGCTDGGDADLSGGQMTLTPTSGTLTADCASCVNTNISLGSGASFVQGVTDSITLVTAAAASDDVWRGYVTGIPVSQTIPAEQAANSYSILMALTVTAS